jgi:hypothetical protein
MVPIDDVAWWWVVDGIGHVLLSECTCGQCPDRYEGLCGRSGPGLKAREMPAAVCPDCRRALASPTLARAEYLGDRMRGT